MKQQTSNSIKGNGRIELNLGWLYGKHSLEIVGGPYDSFAAAPDHFGVCVRAERAATKDKDVWLPIADFSVPAETSYPVMLEGITDTVAAAMAGKFVYVGCMGGWGRTGLFLCLLAKAAGIKDPIAFIRANYTPHAVETKSQEAYVKNFDVRPLRLKLMALGWKSKLAGLRS